MESWQWGGEGRGGRGKFISTLFPKMLILGLDNRKDAAKITMKSFPQRHLVTSDFIKHTCRSPLSWPILGFQMRALVGASKITNSIKRSGGLERISQEAEQELERGSLTPNQGVGPRATGTTTCLSLNEKTWVEPCWQGRRFSG